jgi:glutamine amidotransferase
VISHIRQASVPKALSYANTHPFVRELYGYGHVFAHNGDIPGLLHESCRNPSFYLPLGETDSERAFCLLMDRLRSELSRETVLDLSQKLPVIQSWAEEVSAFGIFNFLLSDTEFLYAHRSTRLFHVSRECFSASECLRSEELTIRLAKPQREAQRLALLATEPLTSNEEWVSRPAGEVVVFRKGSKTE